jgi:hypothetical protein
MVGPAKTPKAPKQNLQGILDELCGLVDCGLNPLATDQVSIREIMARIGRRSYGPLLLVIGLFSISPATVVPGMTWLSAGLTLIIALQLALGMQQPWLPKGMLDRTVSRDLLVKGVNGFRPWARRIDALLKPSLTFLTAVPFVNLIALLCVAAAIITVPLGFIPLAPLAPGLAIVVFGLGLTARDGRLLLLGIAGSAAALCLAWPLVNGIVSRIASLVGGWF